MMDDPALAVTPYTLGPVAEPGLGQAPGPNKILPRGKNLTYIRLLVTSKDTHTKYGSIERKIRI